jgi:glycosyltransferase involved in cell wall biosynthesis
MKIVAHNGATIWGGAERATVMLLKGLAGRGHDVRILCNNELVAERARAQGVEAEILVIAGDIFVNDSLRLARRLRDLAPDAFIVATYKKLFLAALGARIARVPRVVARVGLESDTPRSLKYRFALRRWTDAVAVNSSAMVPAFAALSGFGGSRVRVIHNGVNAPVTSRGGEPLRQRLGIARDAFVIGTVARLAKQKRIDRLIEVMKLLPDDVVCVIAGDGSQRTLIEEGIRHSGLSKRFHLLGDRSDVGDVLAALDVFTITSDREGLSNAMLEAMAAGLPVISTPVSGASDALGPDESGVAAGVVAGFEPAAIANAVLDLRLDVARRELLGQSARMRASRKFSMDEMLDRWESLLVGTDTA